LRSATPLTLDDDDLAELRGVGEHMPLSEVTEVYLPLSRLLNLSVAASRDLFAVTNRFLGRDAKRVPYVIGIAGSVAVGKSTIARVLQALLARWPDHPRVDLVTTDGFLLPNAVLDARGLGARKGFPESYDVRALLRFLADLKAGKPRVTAPVYSHLVYDVLEGAEIVVTSPDIVIVEGLNVLQVPPSRAGREERFVSDFFDFSIYVDADEADIRQWYTDRFMTLRETAFLDERSFFHHFTKLADAEAAAVADDVWREINAVNLRENVAPTRSRAYLVLEKGPDHRVRRVRLSKH
jgi:type I pantothenate kinase